MSITLSHRSHKHLHHLFHGRELLKDLVELCVHPRSPPFQRRDPLVAGGGGFLQGNNNGARLASDLEHGCRHAERVC